MTQPMRLPTVGTSYRANTHVMRQSWLTPVAFSVRLPC
jgi:hypothetical protein